MDDFYFENELKKREKEENENSIQGDFDSILSKIQSGKITDIVDKIHELESILDIYIEAKYGEKSSEYYDKEDKRFQEAFSDESIAELARNYEFSEDEITYVKLAALNDRSSAYQSMLEVLLRTKMLDFFGKECLMNLVDNYSKFFEVYKINISLYKQKLSDKPFGENLEQEYEEKIEKAAERDFNFRINCGGYALKIDRCVFPGGKMNFSESVTRILEEFPFTRLLGDTKLGDDEYLVIYRANNERIAGHHFIRVDDDGVVREKDAAGPVRIFEFWAENLNSEDTGEAIFAVKKEHQMFDVEEFGKNVKIYDFPKRVDMAIKGRINEFDYHGHNFRLKKSEDGDILVIDEKGKFVAYVIAEDEYEPCLVEVDEKKSQYVENTSAKVKPIIKNGILVNYQEIAGREPMRGLEESR